MKFLVFINDSVKQYKIDSTQQSVVWNFLLSNMKNCWRKLFYVTHFLLCSKTHLKPWKHQIRVLFIERMCCRNINMKCFAAAALKSMMSGFSETICSPWCFNFINKWSNRFRPSLHERSSESEQQNHEWLPVYFPIEYAICEVNS